MIKGKMFQSNPKESKESIVILTTILDQNQPLRF